MNNTTARNIIDCLRLYLKRTTRKCLLLLAFSLITFAVSCVPYTRRVSKENLVRIAIVCGVDNVTVGGIRGGKLYDDYQITLKHTLPLFFNEYNGAVTINGKKYRGAIEVRKTGGRIWVINIVDFEDYLKGVVPCEIGGLSGNLIEAAKAQAVAARTYAYAHLNQYDHLGFDLYATIQDQVYNGISAERDLTNRAIEETQREILTYRNEPIEAKYHSTCGGRTADFNDAWQGNAPPYLRSIRCTYCEKSPHYTWNSEFSKKEFYKNLRNRLTIVGYEIPSDERITRIRLKTNKRSKRVREMVIDTEKKEYIIPGYHVRKVLAYKGNPRGGLKSNYFTLKSRGSTIILEGRGFGHGVGMCQFGAIEQARRGKSYKDILRYYYRNARLKKIR